MSGATLDQARAAKARALDMFSAQAEVVGIGITRIGDGYAIKVNLAVAPAADARLPELVDGVPVRIDVVGVVRKQ